MVHKPLRRINSIGLFLVAALVLAIGPGETAEAAFPLVSEQGVPSVAPVLRKVVPGVVNIAVRGREQIDNPLLRDPFFRQFFGVPNQPMVRETQSSGSGVIVDAANGTILTNNHVVQHADLIEITLADKRTFKAKLIGRDPVTDIAVLKIPAENLTAVPFGDSSKAEVGDFVLAIGNPFALGQTVTSGIVSALGRGGLGIEGVEDFIQTDASINPGNSGGALVDLEGRLIGINTAILAPAGGNVGVGFAVPINMARTVMEQLLAHGKIERGWIGVGGQDLTPELAAGLGAHRRTGALIANLQPGSPADQAGLRAGDIVTAIDGTEVTSWREVQNILNLAHVGQVLKIAVERAGQPLSVSVEIAPRPNRFAVQRGVFGPMQELPDEER